LLSTTTQRVGAHPIDDHAAVAELTGAISVGGLHAPLAGEVDVALAGVLVVPVGCGPGVPLASELDVKALSALSVAMQSDPASMQPTLSSRPLPGLGGLGPRLMVLHAPAPPVGLVEVVRSSVDVLP
jgi:hypothetical protein